LTEIAQEAFSSCVDSYRLSASVESHGLTHSALAARSTVRHSLPAIRLNYRLSWPVQIVVPEDAIQGYQTLFTFQLQARRALSLHRRSIITFQTNNKNSNNNNNNPDTAHYHLVRAKLLWFCNTLTTYLSTLVLAPNTARLRTDLHGAADVDDMVAAHAAFVARVLAEACQGATLRPIRECVLDVFDLAVRLEDARGVEAARREVEAREVERLAGLSSPFKASPARAGGRGAVKRRRVMEEDEDEDGEEEEGGLAGRGGVGGERKAYAVV
jgi:gamma-tubulin complex component 5